MGENLGGAGFPHIPPQVEGTHLLTEAKWIRLQRIGLLGSGRIVTSADIQQDQRYAHLEFPVLGVERRKDLSGWKLPSHS